MALNAAVPSLRWRIAAVAASVGAAALLATVLARWGWRWFGPDPMIAPPPTLSKDIDPLKAAASRLFGDAETRVASTASAPQTPSDLRLLGVFAFRNGDGYALIRHGAGAGASVLVRKGQEISPGLTVNAVNPHGITLAGSGGTTEINLRGETLAVQPSVAAAPISSGRQACARPAGFSGEIYRLQGELLGGLITAPASWSALVDTAGGQLTVRDQSGFAAMLGLRAGDRITQANGVALVGTDDVVTHILTPLTRGQAVRVKGIRGDKAREWLLLNAGACPA